MQDSQAELQEMTTTIKSFLSIEELQAQSEKDREKRLVLAEAVAFFIL